MTPYFALAVAALEQHCQDRFGSADGFQFAMAPGRVNLLGDHTDYNDGFVLPMTVDRGVYCALRKRADMRVELHSANFGDSLSYTLDSSLNLTPGDWRSYARGVVDEFRRCGLQVSGVEGAIHGDLPMGAGLSSSAALEVAIAITLQCVFGLSLDPVDMARLCQQVEHRYAGVQCGIMDQFVARLGRRDHALLIDCRTFASRDVALVLGQLRIVVVHSGVKRALVQSKYNDRRAECQQGTRFLARDNSRITALRDVSRDLLEQSKDGLPQRVFNRCLHVINENRRVLEGVDHLAQRRLDRFGRLMNESHASLRDLYEVSCPELDALVQIAQGTDGVIGARMTGGGFGGCMVCLVEEPAIALLGESIRAEFPRNFAPPSDVMVINQNLAAGPIQAGLSP
jgi:galactokinase